MSFWWERYPGRWQREIDSLDASGWKYRVLENAGDRLILISYPLSQSGSARHHQTHPAAEGAARNQQIAPRHVVLVVRFPGAYPFAPPQVFDRAARLPLRRHRDPMSGHLCLCESADWDLDLTATELIAGQLPRVIASNDAGSQIAADVEYASPLSGHGGLPRTAGALNPLEMPFPEPISTYARLGGHPAILVDGSWKIPTETKHGALIAHLSRPPLRPRAGELGPGCVRLLLGPGMEKSMPGEIVNSFPIAVAGAWMRWDGYRPGMTGVEVYEAIEDVLPFVEVLDDGIVQDPELVSIVGLLVPSEVRYREMGEQWLFLIVHRPAPDADFTVNLALGQYAGRTDVLGRVPHTTTLESKVVLIAGVGAVGGTIAQELGKAGVGQLHVVDSDSAVFETSCRQAWCPPHLAGLPKVDVVRAGIAMTSPYCDVTAHIIDIGRTIAPEHEELERLATGVDLLVDATADPGVTRYLAALAQAAGIPYVYSAGTQGAWGGTVYSLTADADACWGCLEHHRADRTTPIPPADPDGLYQSIGCSEPTFVGSSADLGHVALHATRVALDLLAGAHKRSRLDTLALRDQNGKPIAAFWQVTAIERHPACSNHPTSEMARRPA